MKADVTPVLPDAASAGGKGPAKSVGEARTDEQASRSGAAPAVTEAQQLLRYPAWSPPVLAHGVLYLRGKGRVVAIAIQAHAAN